MNLLLDCGDLDPYDQAQIVRLLDRLVQAGWIKQHGLTKDGLAAEWTDWGVLSAKVLWNFNNQLDSPLTNDDWFWLLNLTKQFRGDPPP